MSRMGREQGATRRGRPEVPPGYLDDRRATVLSRLRVTSLCAAGAIGVALLVSPLLEPSWTVGWFVGVGLQLAICAVMYWVAGQSWAHRRSDLLAGSFLVLLALCLPFTLPMAVAKLELFVGYLIVCVIAAALFFPWGARPQAVLGVVLLAWLFLIFPMKTLPSSRVAEVVLLYGVAAFLSVFGALFLDRYRRLAFAEREQARLLARDRALLLDVGRELNSTPDVSALVDRVVRLARPLLACDSVDLQLYDAERSVIRIAAIDAGESDSERSALGLEFAPFPELLAALGEGRVLQLPGDARVRVLEPLLQSGGVEHLLIAPMTRKGEILGWLNFVRTRKSLPFTIEQRELVHGIANQTAIALANARLVDDLQKANRVKSEFVSTMSHELRTPLHVILGYTEMLDDAEAPRDEVVRKVRFAAAELLDLIEATLDLNRLESGRDEPEFEPLRIGDLMDELRDEFGALPRPDAVGLTWRVGAGAAVLSTDRRKLKVIVKNLITNALKFTSEGSVDVVAGRLADAYEVSVRDTGEGIDGGNLDGIFEMFQQVPGELDQSREGVGLGLYIVRRLAEQLGATIDVESQLGQGSHFRLRLPCPAAESEGSDGLPRTRAR